MTTLVKKAKSYCDAHNYRFTDPRRFVLSVIENSSKPLTAYEILEELGQYIKNPKPPTVYRALEFLQQHGFVHCIESMKAYIACEAGHNHKGYQYMICDQCKGLTEIHMCDMPESLIEKVDSRNFNPDFWNLEIHGLCSKCTN